MLLTTVGLWLLLAQGSPALSQSSIEERAYTCTVTANGDGSDDTENILEAFEECNKSGRNIIFSKDTIYYVNQVMNTTNLNNVTIDIYGTLLVRPPGSCLDPLICIGSLS